MANVCKVAMRWTITAVPASGFPADPITDIVTTFHVHKLASLPEPTVVEHELVAAATLAWWNVDGDLSPALRGTYPAGVSMTAVEVRNVEPSLSDTLVVPNPTPAGTAVAESMGPPCVAWVIGMRTTEDSRRHRGRMYLPTGATAQVPPEWRTGRVNTTARETLAKLAAQLAANVAAITAPQQDWALAVYSRVERTSLAVTHFDLPDVLGVQRPRMFSPAGRQVFGLDGEP